MLILPKHGDPRIAYCTHRVAPWAVAAQIRAGYNKNIIFSVKDGDKYSTRCIVEGCEVICA